MATVRYGVAYPSGTTFIVASEGHTLSVGTLGDAGLVLFVVPDERVTIGGQVIRPGERLVLDPRAFVFVQRVDGGWGCAYSPYAERHFESISPPLRDELERVRDRWTIDGAMNAVHRIAQPKLQRETNRPWMTAIEMQYAALSLTGKLSQMADVPKSVTDSHVLRWLPTSVPFAWSSEIVDAVWTASKSIPDDARFEPEMLPDGLRAAWWWLGSPIPIPLKEQSVTPEDAGDMDVNGISALMLALTPTGTLLICDGRMTSFGVPMMTGLFEISPSVTLKDVLSPDHLELNAATGIHGDISPRAIALTRFVMAASVWLRQRIAVVSSGRIERHLRKRLLREHRVVGPLDINVVQLRRAERSSCGDVNEGGDVEWSCRWVVNGHWRNQYHPSDGRHELKYILPYVKGPDDKPLKVPKHTVYSVSR